MPVGLNWNGWNSRLPLFFSLFHSSTHSLTHSRVYATMWTISSVYGFGHAVVKKYARLVTPPHNSRLPEMENYIFKICVTHQKKYMRKWGTTKSNGKKSNGNYALLRFFSSILCSCPRPVDRDSLTSFTVNKTMITMTAESESKEWAGVWVCAWRRKKLSDVSLFFSPFSFPYRTDVNWKKFMHWIAAAYNFKSKKSENKTHKKNQSFGLKFPCGNYNMVATRENTRPTHFIIFHFILIVTKWDFSPDFNCKSIVLWVLLIIDMQFIKP